MNTILNYKAIREILPHRYPFLFVDKVISMDLENNEIVGQKNVTINEQFFQGHFPEVPVMPGVLVLEALAQTGGILVHQKNNTDRIAFLLNITNAKFRNPVKPGDILYLHAKALHITNKAGKITAKAIVDGKVVVEAELSFALIERSKL